MLDRLEGLISPEVVKSLHNRSAKVWPCNLFAHGAIDAARAKQHSGPPPTASDQALVAEEQTLAGPVSPMLEPAQQYQDWCLGSSGRYTIAAGLTYFTIPFPRRPLF